MMYSTRRMATLGLVVCGIYLCVLETNLLREPVDKQQQTSKQNERIDMSLGCKQHDEETDACLERAESQQKRDCIVQTGLVGQNNHTNTVAANSTARGVGQTAILHVGPHKTGTTFLQSQIVRLEKSLRKDDYGVPLDIPGRHIQLKSMANIALSLQGLQDFIEPSTWPAFMDFMHQTKLNGMNVLLSSEEFDKPTVDIDTIVRILKPWNQVRVVVGYRRVFEFLQAYYFEMHRFSIRDFPSFVDWLISLKMSPTWRHEIQGSNVVDRYSKYFNDIFIVNYHDDKSRLDDIFFCDAIPSADQTCQQVRASQSPPRMNRGSSLEYRRLVNSAKSRRIIRPEVDVQEAEKQIKVFHEVKHNKTLLNFPRHCLDDDLTELLFQISLKEEQVMAPQRFEKAVVRAAFNAFKDSGALCAINVTQVLADEDWKAFLRGI